MELGSEIASPGELGDHLRAGELVDRQPVPARRGERADRPLGDLQPRSLLPTAGLELRDGCLQVCYSVDEHRPVALQVVGEDELRGTVGKLQQRDAGAHALDGEHDARAEHLLEVILLSGNITARAVDIVEPLEHALTLRANERLTAVRPIWPDSG